MCLSIRWMSYVRRCGIYKERIKMECIIFWISHKIQNWSVKIYHFICFLQLYVGYDCIFKKIITMYSMNWNEFYIFFIFFPEPYAAYKIWIKAYTVKNEGKSSEPVDVTTDVRAPGQPIGEKISLYLFCIMHPTT